MAALEDVDSPSSTVGTSRCCDVACTQPDVHPALPAGTISQLAEQAAVEIDILSDTSGHKQFPTIGRCRRLSSKDQDAQVVDAPVADVKDVRLGGLPLADVISRIAKEVAALVTQPIKATLEEHQSILVESLRYKAPRGSRASTAKSPRRVSREDSPTNSLPTRIFRTPPARGSHGAKPARPSLSLQIPPVLSQKKKTSLGNDSASDDEGFGSETSFQDCRKSGRSTKELPPIAPAVPGIKQRRESHLSLDVQTLKFQLSGALLRGEDLSAPVSHALDAGSPRVSVRMPAISSALGGRRFSAAGHTFSAIFGKPEVEKVVPEPATKDTLPGESGTSREKRSPVGGDSGHEGFLASWNGKRKGSSASSATTADVSMARLRKMRTCDLLDGINEHRPFENESSSDSDTEDSSMTSACDSEAVHTDVPLILRMFGLHPWQGTGCTTRWLYFSAAYPCLVLVLAIASTLGVAEQTVSTRSTSLHDTLCYSQGCLRLGLIADLPIAVGAVLSLLALGVHRRSRDFQEVALILANSGERQGYTQLWRSHTHHHIGVTFFLWFLTVALRMHNSRFFDAVLKGTITTQVVLQMMGFTFITGLLLALSFCMLFVCTALSTMVDVFCLTILNKDSLCDSVRDWNILQAVLRKASHTIQVCFFVLQSTALAILLTSVADAVVAGYYMDLVPSLLVFAGISRIIYSAASVTDKCSHVPSLISSFCNTIDTERQYVTQHIIHSAAGFYVFEVLLTSTMVMKFTYFTIVAAFTLATKLLSDSDG